MFESIRSCIEQYDTIILHRHSQPDGDALGSQIGLKHLILENYPHKRVYAVGDAAGRYAFMQDAPFDDLADEAYSGALAIILDTGARALISDNRYTLAAATARIDHHIFCEKIADAEVIETSYESCCGLVTALALEAGWRIPPIAAQALYTGTVTDSGRFRYDSTTPDTLRRAAELLAVGIDTAQIYRDLYADDFSRILLRSKFVLKVNFTEHNVAYIYTTKEEAAACGVDTFTISRGMVGVMSEIRGVDIWVNFTETEGGVLCELRSGRYNINPIAVKYGGGGHEKASGATVESREVAMQMLADLDQIMEVNQE
ncbi:MAG: bifunctional oligoribonuclease/PAP phosphatase NrnA [Clostridia bacterium]|nr:bifunctional oligoribonuclease/PAP phosphatase NrnA [Clostridia bacterium]